MWTGVKCNFSWVHHHKQYVIGKLSIGRDRILNFTRIVVGKLSISQVRMCNFTRIGCKTKSYAFDNYGMKAIWAASPGPTPKRCELPLFLAALGQAIRRWKALDLGSFNMQFQDCQKIKNHSSLKFLLENLEKIRSSERLSCTSRGIDNFSLAQLHEPYVVGKLSIREA